MFQNKKVKELETSVSNLIEAVTIINKNCDSIIQMLESLHKRLNLHQEMINSLGKQIDIIAVALQLKTQITISKDKPIIKKD